ncbi:MAG TPA: response regulator [Candidatus Sulfotelmatobacter sp.]|nr:response regulator [Candidatus Sulfotelmatobacter sp.]
MAKVLLVEDDNNLREIYEARLQAEGYNIVSAKDGEEALAVAKAERPDLVISDIMMPKISGFEMLDILRNTNELKNLKIIMLTALGQSDDQQRATKLGADKYLVKSQVTLEDIVKASHELLGDIPGRATGPAPAATPAPPVSGPVAAPLPQPNPTEPQAVVKDEEAVAADKPETENQEVKDVDKQVEQVMDSAPNGPAPSTSDSPAPVVPSPPTGSDAANNDKVMNEAVNSLMTPEAPVKEETAEAPKIQVTAATDNAKPVTPSVPPTQVVAPESTDNQAGDNVTIAHKKVIAPLDTKDKPDINDLLAKEEAEDQPSGQPTLPPSAVPPSGGDPNNIAI